MDGLSTNEYSSCTYEIDNRGKASITLTGSGKFEGYACTGNKNDMTCESGEVSGNTLTIQEALDMGLVWYDIDDNSVAIGLRDAQISALHQNFTTLEIPSKIGNKKVVSVGDSAFEGCDNLTSVTIQNGVTSIGNNAFYYCDNLISVAIPNSVTNIGTNAFDGTPWVQNLDYDENGLIILGGVLHAIDPEISGSITIPSSVTSMREGAFYGLENLTNVTFSANKFYTLNNEFNDTTWFTNNSSNGYIIGSNYLVRSVEEYSSR